ncbi:MAG: DUF3887 domain-containing protein [Prochlorococcaceae cyanobacterium]
MPSALTPPTAAVVAGLALGLALAGIPRAVLAQDAPGAAAANGSLVTRARLSVDEARQAANRILEAVQTRDPNRRFAQFSPELKAISSPELVAERIAGEPRLLSWTLLSVRGGLRATTVEASLQTADGTRDLFMVLNDRGELEGYHFDLTDADTAKVARDFVEALSSGQFVTARSFLSLPLQEEFSAAALQSRWQQLQQRTGDFVAVRRVVEVDRSGDTYLALVNTEFADVTDSLFVILNTNNEIVGVNFPQDPVRPRKFSRPTP